VNHYPEGAILSGGLSKWCGAGGWRLGFFIVPKKMRWLLDAMAAVASETFTSTAAPIQHAAITAVEGGPEIDDYLVRCRRILAAMAERLVRTLTGAGLHVTKPDGGFYLFLDFGPVAERLRERGLTKSSDLCQALIEQTGVALLPGREFGRPVHELTARLAFVDFDGTAALAASSGPVDDAFVERYCARTVEGVRRICAWVS
jgi:aspartate aminotransferase